MLFDGITYETMSKKTGISSQLLEYWDNKYRYILIDEFEKRMANRRKKKVKKETRWHRYGAGAGRYEQEKKMKINEYIKAFYEKMMISVRYHGLYAKMDSG